MFSREAIEERERRTLEPYALFAADSRGRRHDEPADPFRPAFHRDRDRVIHSTAFRRLEYKTQVFVSREGDYYRTRLTHTLEVAQIARSCASALGLNEAFVEALSLAHDLGHPPFGHAGGEVLHARMDAHGGFEHNVQALRIIDTLERRYPGFPGLNLSFELREAVLKHGPTGPDAQTDEFTPMRPPALETQLVDLADSTAYNHHDLDDGLRSGLLDFDDLCNSIPLVSSCREVAEREHKDLGRRDLLFRTIDRIVKESIRDLITSSHARLEAANVESADAARDAGALICFSAEMAERQSQLQDYLFDNFYRHFRVVRMMDKAKRVLGALFDIYVERPELLPPDFQRQVDERGLHRTVCDYIAGMTDRFAELDHRKLFDPSERV